MALQNKVFASLLTVLRTDCKMLGIKPGRVGGLVGWLVGWISWLVRLVSWLDWLVSLPVWLVSWLVG